MNERMRFYLSAFDVNKPGATEQSLTQLEVQENFELPVDFKDLMKEFNGAEGEIGENSWLVLFPIEDLLSANRGYKSLMDQIPDYFLFGKDAADTGYAINKQDKSFHSFGLMSDFNTDPIEFCGSSLNEFLDYLYNQ